MIHFQEVSAVGRRHFRPQAQARQGHCQQTQGLKALVKGLVDVIRLK